jgi:hypothetical protein
MNTPGPAMGNGIKAKEIHSDVSQRSGKSSL